MDERLLQIETFPVKRSGNMPMVIAGPCSAESEKQVMDAAQAVAAIPQVSVFRAGVWKPRTRPGDFEGVGEKGLQWLNQVKHATGLSVITEVAQPDHVEKALNYNIDMLWIGARTVVNPFSVQELADALKGVDIPVLVKNPVTPDLSLWIGALERINKAGIHQLAAVHRGFYLFERSPFRNAPMWEIPIELKRQYPELPLICDPSHISGNTEYIRDVSQKALDLAMDGLMIESHCNPADALTDIEQQITPETLKQLLESLNPRKETGNQDFQNKLQSLRSEIDKLDTEMLDILAKRMHLVNEIGEYKKDNNITIFQLKRWNEIVSHRLQFGKEKGLEKDFLHNLLKIIHTESIRLQNEILNNGKRE